jgi:16S rRNA (cytosine967-C5)-methyltransferase
VASRAVRAGGRLIYATCSPLQAEDEQVVDAFLAANADFTLAPPAVTLGDRLASELSAEHALRLWSQRHGTGSFFAALLVRAA